MQVAVGGGSTNRPAFLGNSIEPGTAVTLTPGSSYSVTETPVPGYTQRMPLPAECSDTISAGQTKTCTIINDDNPATLRVIKQVINNNGRNAQPGDFIITVTGGGNPSPASFRGSSTGTTVTLNAGSYSVSETVAGYTAAFSAQCSGIIRVGETRTCTITNDDKPPQTPEERPQTQSATRTQRQPTSEEDTSPISPPITDLEIIRLGNSSFPAHGVRPLADVAPSNIIGCHILANLPPGNDIKLIAAEITDTGVEHAVVAQFIKTIDVITGETLYHIDLGPSITGTNPFTGRPDTVSKVTELLLWNSNPNTEITFDYDHTITMFIIAP
jgi:prealbumin domain-containing protein